MNLKWRLFIAIAVLYVLGIIGGAWHTYDATNSAITSKAVETIKIIFIMLGGLGIILPTYLNIWQSLEASRVLEDQGRRAKIENAFQIFQAWDSSSLLQARKFTRELKDKESSLSADEIVKRITDEPELRQSVILLFNYFDLIRISLKYNRIESNLVKDSLSEIIKDVCKRFDPWAKKQSQQHREHVQELLKLLQ